MTEEPKAVARIPYSISYSLDGMEAEMAELVKQVLDPNYVPPPPKPGDKIQRCVDLPDITIPPVQCGSCERLSLELQPGGYGDDFYWICRTEGCGAEWDYVGGGGHCYVTEIYKGPDEEEDD